MISIIPSISTQDIGKAMKDSGILDKLKKYKGATFDVSSILSDKEKYTIWYSNSLYLNYVLGLYGFTIKASGSSNHYSIVDISRDSATILAPSEMMGFVIGRKGKNIEELKTKHSLKSVVVKVLNNPKYHTGGAETILEICSLLDKCEKKKYYICTTYHL